MGPLKNVFGFDHVLSNSSQARLGPCFDHAKAGSLIFTASGLERDLFFDPFGNVQCAQVIIREFSGKETDLLAVLEILIDDDPAVLQNSARAPLRCFQVLVRNLDRKRLCNMFEIRERNFHADDYTFSIAEYSDWSYSKKLVFSGGSAVLMIVCHHSGVVLKHRLSRSTFLWSCLFFVNFQKAHHGDIRILESLLDVCELGVGNLENEICLCCHCYTSCNTVYLGDCQ